MAGSHPQRSHRNSTRAKPIQTKSPRGQGTEVSHNATSVILLGQTRRSYNTGLLKKVIKHFQTASTTALGGLEAVTVPAGVSQVPTSESGYQTLARPAGFT